MKLKKTNAISDIYLNCLIIGQSGYGKTTLASTLKEKTIIVSLESGLLSLKNFNIDYLEVDPSDKYNSLIKICSFITKSDYKNVFFDSLTEISEIFVEEGEKHYPDSRQALQKWGHYNNSFKKFIKFTRDLRINCFYTCLEKTDKDDIGRRYSLPDVPGKLSSSMPQYFDYVFNIRIIKNEDGEEVRKLLTKSTDGIVAKDRSGSLDTYEEMNLQKIIDKSLKEKK